MSLPDASIAEIANIGDRSFRLDMMRKSIVAIQSHGGLSYPLLNMICAFIDGLVSAPRNRNRALYHQYLATHFPALCAELRAIDFYDHFRNHAIHTFGLGNGYAIGRDAGLGGKYIATQRVAETGQVLTILNIDRLAADFLAHITALTSVR